ncbi:inositol monophosphatase family protein [Mangrovicoccus sp. HB182678]|uniref:3'(2'),5'-bisphosphate nucleotidase n=2 Tax=Mangrovicoccus algicola TaxID=2771008 RepID=A0A8J6Z9T6_9RHOB|nr:inositol monophosphatase family protein [Mangrovicoccus algicola]MBE3638681.1 inositol monophosphatase family protein [Mangrovicoccus algicola]
MPRGSALSQSLIDTAHALADAARAETLAHFRNPGLDAANKAAAGFDPVTEGDRAAEAAMRAILAERRPGDGVFGEEYGITRGSSGLTWVLDPIDGTRGFLSGTPTWGVLIAACEGTRPVYGIIDQPFIGERFEGGLGVARYRGPQGEAPLRSRQGVALKDAILFSTFPEIGTAQEAARFREVSARARLTRFGMDCYAYGLLALGHVDLVIEAGLQRYDIAGPIAVIEAAGGIVTDWQGGPADEGGRILAAGSPELHAEALALLSGTAAEGAA